MNNTILENIILPLGDTINRSSFIKELKYWRNVDTLSENKLRELQESNLRKIIEHAVKTVPHYKHIELKTTNPYGWIKQLPILTKDILRRKNEELISDLYNKENLIPYSSSGSSGIQSTVFMNKKEQSTIRAILLHWWEWSGYKIGNPLVQTGITPNRGVLKTIKDILFKTIYVSAFNISKEELKSICNRMQKSNKYFLAGYASSLNVIAEYALENNFNIKLNAAISLGDKLFNHYKENIEKAFQTKVYDTYGCNEGFLIASEKDINYKYIMSPHVYIEILDDDDKPVKDGEMGNIVVSRLDGFSMPLLRYRIGDLGILLPKEKYPTKREFNYPLLQQIVGRETDVVKLPGGTRMVVHSFTGIFEYIPEIKQFKVVQDSIDYITIEYIKSKDFTSKALERTTKELQKYIQNSDFKIIYKEVTYIAPTKSGKPQIIESKLKKQL